MRPAGPRRVQAPAVATHAFAAGRAGPARSLLPSRDSGRGRACVLAEEGVVDDDSTLLIVIGCGREGGHSAGCQYSGPAVKTPTAGPELNAAMAGTHAQARPAAVAERHGRGGSHAA